MKLKSLILGAVAAGSMVAVSTVASSAQAASVGGSLFVDQSGSGGVLAVDSNGVDFAQTPNFFKVTDQSTGDFAPFRGSSVVTVLQDLPRTFTSAFNFLKVDDGSVDGILVRVTGLVADPGFTGNSYFANLTGGFVSGGTFTPIKDESFTFAAKISNPGFSNEFVDIAIGAQAVPTPALLPGLVGMGVAALRKRKSEELESAEA